MKNRCRDKTEGIKKGLLDSSAWLVLGLVLTVAISVKTVLMGANAFVSIHDQLDGEVTTYILRAKHMGDSIIPEFMGGVPTAALIPASFGTLGFYLLFEPVTAFNLNYAFVQIIAFMGLYLLLVKLKVRTLIAVIVSLLYCILPFFSVYGLSIMGQPLLWYAILDLSDRRSVKAYGISAVFAMFSSPFLVGFADCALIMCLTVAHYIKGKRSGMEDEKKRGQSLLFMLLLILGIYILFYHKDIIAPGFVSHREKMILSAIINWKQAIVDIWSGSQPHAISNHKGFIHWIISVQFAGLVFLPIFHRREKHLMGHLVGLILSAFLIALFYAAFHGQYAVKFRNHLGGTLKSVQFDRVYWFYPGIWYTMLGLAAELIALGPTQVCRYLSKDTPSDLTVSSYLKKKNVNGMFASFRRNPWYVISKASSFALVLALLLTTGLRMYDESVIKKNLNGNVSTSFASFYSPELFRDIADYIRQTTGKQQNEYYVASIALYPSVPLYNNYFCIDGYSNNYPLEYKQLFRKVIKKELDNNEDIQKYFDEWGNRCYLFTSELGRNYYFTKKYSGKLQNLELDIDALKDLKCSYIFSGMEIENCNVLHLMKSFENEASPYRIWVYSLE